MEEDGGVSGDLPCELVGKVLLRNRVVDVYFVHWDPRDKICLFEGPLAGTPAPTPKGFLILIDTLGLSSGKRCDNVLKSSIGAIGMSYNTPEVKFKRARDLRKEARLLKNPGARSVVERAADRLETQGARQLNRIARNRKQPSTPLQ